MNLNRIVGRFASIGHCNEEFPMDWQSLFTRLLIIACKKAYGGRSGNAWSQTPPQFDMDGSIDFIERGLRSGRPFMAGKIGSGDLETLMRREAIRADGSLLRKWVRLAAGKTAPFWYDNWIRTGIGVCAGVFPISDESIEEFCSVFEGFCDAFDAVPSYGLGDERIYRRLCPGAKIIRHDALVPFAHPRTWYGALEGRRVLVVHPYVASIRMQYEKNVEFHAGQGALPRFDMVQYRPVNSIGGKCDGFAKWKDALDSMIADIDKIDFDVALLGCGVYGVPLSAHIKRGGRQAVYTGGATQIMFGIKGRRWDPAGIYNEHWIRPLPEDVPANMSLIEGGTFL